MTDSQRILELRRRVQADPASIAFAQLAEECRRAGNNDEAVGICRNGLAKHPGYLSARVTLARALIELGELDAAKRELDIVVQSAPDNMAAIRGLAEIAQQQGSLDTALDHYKHALRLASHDADLESAVDRISQAIAPPLGIPPADVAPVAVEELFDFDKLLEELGEPIPQEPTPTPPASLDLPVFLHPSDVVAIKPDDTDELAVVERELRAFEAQRAKDEEQRRRAEEEQGLREIAAQHLREAEEARLRVFEAEQRREREAQLLREAAEREERLLEEQRAKDEETAREQRAREEQRLRYEEEQRRRAEDERRLREVAAQHLREAEEARLRTLEAERLRELEAQQLREAAAREERLLEEQRTKDEEAAREQRAREEQRLRDEEEQRRRADEEQRLREIEAQRLLEAQRARDEEAAREQRARDELQTLAREADEARRLLARRRHDAVLNGLEGWLTAIAADREHDRSS